MDNFQINGNDYKQERKKKWEKRKGKKIKNKRKRNQFYSRKNNEKDTPAYDVSNLLSNDSA